jgi:DNA-binding response OmpR family regulator
MKTILVVDDEPKIAALARDYLEHAGYAVVVASNGRAALDAVARSHPDLVVLDLGLPELDGLDVTREIRRDSTLPIVMLTARDDELDTVLGLELGADDYIPKPCNPRELAARLRAVLRRARGEGGEALTDLRNGPIWLRASSRSVTVDDKPVALTATEFDLLALLLREAGRVVSKERISQSVLGRPLGPFDRSIDVHVSNLRRKLGNTNDGTSPITTIHRSGYLFRQLGEPA